MVHDGVRLVVVVHRLDAGWSFGRIELGRARRCPVAGFQLSDAAAANAAVREGAATTDGFTVTVRAEHWLHLRTARSSPMPMAIIAMAWTSAELRLW